VGKKKKPVSAEEFDAWRDDPVTAWVMSELSKAAEKQREYWLVMSWDGGVIDKTELEILRERASAYRALAELSYADIAEIEE
jgi:uncharacterized phage-associated protein